MEPCFGSDETYSISPDSTMHLVNYLEQCKKLLVVNYFEIKIKEIIPFSYKNSLSNNRDEDPESIILVRQNVISSVSEAIFYVFLKIKSVINQVKTQNSPQIAMRRISNTRLTDRLFCREKTKQ